MESIIKITKRASKSVVTDRIFTDEAMTPLLTEVESIINSRPLTAVSDGINDLDPITPNHLLMVNQAQVISQAFSKNKKLVLERNGKQFKWHMTCFGKGG